MARRITFIFSAIMFFQLSQAQKKFFKNVESYEFTVFNNQYYFPFLGVKNIFTSKYHAGISAGIVKNIDDKKKSTFYYDLKLGIYSHRFIQTGIQLYGDIGYRYKFPKNFFAAHELGLGYLHAIVHQSSFKADENGNYTKVKSIGKPQFLISLNFKVGKQIKIAKTQGRAFISYQPWFQMPYINSYVPLLPNNSFHLGFDLLIGKSK